MSWRLDWSRSYPAVAGQAFPASGQLNYARALAPATGPWGQAMQLMAHRPGGVVNNPPPLVAPTGEKDLIGFVATEALAAAIVQAPKGYQGTTPTSLQSLVTATAPWDVPTNQIPGGGQGLGF